MKLDETIQERLSALIAKGEALQVAGQDPQRWVEKYAEWRNQGVVFFEQVFGMAYTYTRSFASQTEDRKNSAVSSGLGILRAALEDVEQGYLSTLEDMAAAEVFSDFLDQADYLRENGYVAPAASLAGAVLENGLRSLAGRNGVTVRTKDDLSSFNNKLSDKRVYSRLRQKQLAVWIQVRNDADHGRFDEVTPDNVADLVKGVRNFLAEVL